MTDTSNAGPGPSAYVALGDSISIDDYSGGPGTGGASLLFCNRDQDFPEWRGCDVASTMPNAAFTMLATDGATTSTLLDTQVPRVLSSGIQPSLVTLTIGGNDLLGVYGSTHAAGDTIRRVAAAVSRTLAVLGPELAPGGRIIVGTVYDPSDGTGDAARLGLPEWPDAVQVIAELNDALRASAATHDAAVADIHRAFLGHGALAGDATRPDPRPSQRELWLCSVIEPNAWGASGVRAAFWAAMRASSTAL